jgi:hypothetical protein
MDELNQQKLHRRKETGFFNRYFEFERIILIKKPGFCVNPDSGTKHIALHEDVRTFLIAQTLDFIAYSFFLLL